MRKFITQHLDSVKGGRSLSALNRLATLYMFRDEPDRARGLYSKELKLRLPLGERDPDVLWATFGLGNCCTYSGRFAEGEPLMQKAFQGLRAVLGDRHPYTLTSESQLARIHLITVRLSEAEQEASDAYRMRRAVLGPLHGQTLYSQGLLGLVYLAQGRRADAEPLLREFQDHADRLRDRLPPFTIWEIADVGHALLEQRDFAKAASFLQLNLDVAAKKQPEGWRRAAARSALGACSLGQKKYAEAEPMLRKGYEGLRQFESGIPASFRRTELGKALKRLAQLYDEWSRPEEAAKWHRELESMNAAKPVTGPNGA